MHRLTNNWTKSSVGFSSSCFPLSESLWQVKMQTHIRPITISKKKKDQENNKLFETSIKNQIFSLVLNFLHKQGYMYIKDRNSAKSVHLHNMNVFQPLVCTIPRREGELQVWLQTVGWTAVISGGWMLADLGQRHLLVVTLQFAFGQQIVSGRYMIVQVSV